MLQQQQKSMLFFFLCRLPCINECACACVYIIRCNVDSVQTNRIHDEYFHFHWNWPKLWFAKFGLQNHFKEKQSIFMATSILSYPFLMTCCSSYSFFFCQIQTNIQVVVNRSIKMKRIKRAKIIQKLKNKTIVVL